MKTRLLKLKDDPAAMEEGRRCLEAGGLVAIPTETVYGLAADATNGTAVARIFEAKGRPRFNPLICHVSSIDMAEDYAELDAMSCRLVEMFWPGSLTLVLPARPGAAIHPLVRGGLDTLALRCPTGFARELIAALGRPLAAPSANPSGRVSATTADQVLRGLDGRIDLVIDGGPARLGLESTIVKAEAGCLRLLRPGAVASDVLAARTGLPVMRREEGDSIQAPGQLRSHYAPAGHVRLNATRVEPGEALIKFGPAALDGEADAAAIFNLSESGDLREAASRLFAALAAFDRPEIAAIAVAPIPDEGLGEAINDRLGRAAAPRDS